MELLKRFLLAVLLSAFSATAYCADVGMMPFIKSIQTTSAKITGVDTNDDLSFTTKVNPSYSIARISGILPSDSQSDRELVWVSSIGTDGDVRIERKSGGADSQTVYIELIEFYPYAIKQIIRGDVDVTGSSDATEAINGSISSASKCLLFNRGSSTSDIAVDDRCWVYGMAISGANINVKTVAAFPGGAADESNVYYWLVEFSDVVIP